MPELAPASRCRCTATSLHLPPHLSAALHHVSPGGEPPNQQPSGPSSRGHLVVSAANGRAEGPQRQGSNCASSRGPVSSARTAEVPGQSARGGVEYPQEIPADPPRIPAQRAPSGHPRALDAPREIPARRASRSTPTVACGRSAVASPPRGPRALPGSRPGKLFLLAASACLSPAHATAGPSASRARALTVPSARRSSCLRQRTHRRSRAVCH